jgi:hypothetical protein
MRPISVRLPLRWRAQRRSCRKFQPPLLCLLYPSVRRLLSMAGRVGRGARPRSFRQPVRCFPFRASRQFLRRRRPLRRAGRISQQSRPHQQPQRQLQRVLPFHRSRTKSRAIPTMWAEPTRGRARSTCQDNTKYSLSRACLECRRRVFQKRLHRSRACRTCSPRWAPFRRHLLLCLRRAHRKQVRVPQGSHQDPLQVTVRRLRFPNLVPNRPTREKLSTWPRRNFPQPASCSRFPACPERSRLLAFRFCRRQFLRSLPLKVILACH